MGHFLREYENHWETKGRVLRVRICCSWFCIPMSLSKKGRPPPSASSFHVCESPVTKKRRKEKGRDVSAGSTARIPLSSLIVLVNVQAIAADNRMCELCTIIALEGSERASSHRYGEWFFFLSYIAITVISYCQQFTLTRTHITTEYIRILEYIRIANYASRS